MRLQLESLLTVSTVHISRQTLDALSDMPTDWFVVAYPNEYGALICVGSLADGRSSMPEDMLGLLEFGRANSIDWIKLDADGPEIEGLPTYRNTWDLDAEGSQP